MPDTYRSAASILVLRPVDVCSPDGCGAVHQILLLHKPRKRDAWQLPQGGMEAGETVTEAALRELSEEAGLTDCRVIGTSSHVYCYDFPESYRRFRPDNVCGQRIEYVFALAPKDAKVVVDQHEIDAYQWVDASRVGVYVERQEYRDLVRGLYEEALTAVASQAIS